MFACSVDVYRMQKKINSVDKQKHCLKVCAHMYVQNLAPRMHFPAIITEQRAPHLHCFPYSDNKKHRIMQRKELTSYSIQGKCIPQFKV